MGDTVTDKKLTEVPQKTAITTAAELINIQGSALARTPVSALVDLTTRAAETAVKSDIIDVHLDGVFVMYHRKSDDYSVLSKPSAWVALQTSGEVADGVLLIQGDKRIVVSPTETTLPWSSQAILAGAAVTDRIASMEDWDGKTKTAAICANATLSADGASYAPGWCHAYSRTNANGKGLTAGKWWLPSAAQLLLMMANKTKINLVLGLINGATLLTDSWYWSSTEGSATSAWNLIFGDGNLNTGGKVSSQRYVRAVSDFIG